MEFENSPQVLAIKAESREFFYGIIDAFKGAFAAFYEWLKTVPLPAPPTMLKLFGNNKANLILFTAVNIFIIFINIKTYMLFAADKRYAVQNKERIPEKRLFGHMWAGGAPGAALAMVFKRHKTQHTSFVVNAVVLVSIQLIIYSMLLGFLGFWTFF